MCGILRKLIARFQKKKTYEKKFGSDLQVLCVVETISYPIGIMQLELRALGKQCKGNCKTGKKLQHKLDVSIVQVRGTGP